MKLNIRLLLFFILIGSLLFSEKTKAQNSLDSVDNIMNEWHDAMRNARFGPFLTNIAQDGVIIGTGKYDRWSKLQINEFSKRYFNKSMNWAYHLDKRNVYFNTDSTTAWFDETFTINTVGFRGNGILLKDQGKWLIQQYTISLTQSYEQVKSAISGNMDLEVHNTILLVLGLFFFMSVLFVCSQKLNISYPILLVIGGLIISLIPGVPVISLNPDIVFLVFLPPLLFEAAWYTNWDMFVKWRHSILVMGFGLVFITSLAIAYFSISIIPGFTLALGFLLGGIISPPDAVAASSVLKGISIPRRGITILEGESLVNDAASLTVFRLALATFFMGGTFTVEKGVTDFLVLSIMGVVVGLVIAHILYIFLKYVAKASSISTPITLIAPYLMYIVAEHFEWSGVLAVVAGGLFLSFRSSDYLNHHTSIQTKEVWSTIGFLLNGFVFILIGLELPVIIEGLGQYSKEEAINYALMIAAMIIVLRVVAVFVASIIPKLFSKKIRKSKEKIGWKLQLVVGWAGMRGVVSLASALAIPLTLHDGSPFPHRNLILFITFVVILVTLVFQGLTLPLLIKWIKITDDENEMPEQVQISEIRLQMAKESIAYLDMNYASEMASYETIAQIKEQLQRSIDADERANQQNTQQDLMKVRELYRKIMVELIALRRRGLNRLRSEKMYSSEIIRELEYTLDLEESRLIRK